MKKILVSLDELLDTRLGYISTFYPSIATRYLADGNNEYFLRAHDYNIYNDIGITKEEWFELWQYRDKDILKNSVVSYIPNIIEQLVFDYQRSTEDALDEQEIELVVNIHPYILTENEKAVFDDIISNELFPYIEKISFISKSYKDLDYKYLRNQFDIVFMYYFNRWIEVQETIGKGVTKRSFGKCQFYIPRIYNEIPDVTNLPEDNRKLAKRMVERDLFELIEHALSVRIKLLHVPISDWCAAVRPPYKAESSLEIPTLSDVKTGHSFQCDPLVQVAQEQGLVPED